MRENSHEDCHELDSNNCTVVAYQKANVSVPVTVKPKVHAGDVNTFCCGDPHIKRSSYSVRYNHLSDSSDSSCSFVISQNICIEIPIEFTAKTYVQDPHIECRGASI